MPRGDIRRRIQQVEARRQLELEPEKDAYYIVFSRGGAAATGGELKVFMRRGSNREWDAHFPDGTIVHIPTPARVRTWEVAAGAGVT